MADLPRWARPPAAALIAGHLVAGAGAIAACRGDEKVAPTADTWSTTGTYAYGDTFYFDWETSESGADSGAPTETGGPTCSGASSGTGPTTGTGPATGTGPSSGSGTSATPARVSPTPALAPLAPPDLALPGAPLPRYPTTLCRGSS